MHDDGGPMFRTAVFHMQRLRSGRAASPDLFGLHLGPEPLAGGRLPGEAVAPLHGDVRAVAIGFVGRTSAAADHDAIADLVGASVLAAQRDAAPDPEPAARPDGLVLDQPEARFEPELVDLPGGLVAGREPCGGAQGGLADRLLAGPGIVRALGQAPGIAVRMAEAGENAVLRIVFEREGSSLGPFDIAPQRLVRGGERRVPRRPQVRAVAIGLAPRSAAAAERRPSRKARLSCSPSQTMD